MIANSSTTGTTIASTRISATMIVSILRFLRLKNPPAISIYILPFFIYYGSYRKHNYMHFSRSCQRRIAHGCSRDPICDPADHPCGYFDPTQIVQLVVDTDSGKVQIPML